LLPLLSRILGTLSVISSHLGNPVFPDVDRTFPFPTEYVSLGDSNTRPFKYQNQLSSDKLLFCGLAGDDVICIKFTRRYSKDAHLKCASLGFAPTLRGFESLPGGWFMAVMDLLGDDYQLLSERRDRAQFCEEIQTKVSDLHQAGFVHGDIRPTNVMVKKSGPPGVMLLDFDWAGVIGEARYPMNVNAQDIKRPGDAIDNGLIKAEHDREMISFLPRNF